jgi:hypothetical protein
MERVSVTRLEVIAEQRVEQPGEQDRAIAGQQRELDVLVGALITGAHHDPQPRQMPHGGNWTQLVAPDDIGRSPDVLDLIGGKAGRSLGFLRWGSSHEIAAHLKVLQAAKEMAKLMRDRVVISPALHQLHREPGKR